MNASSRVSRPHLPLSMPQGHLTLTQNAALPTSFPPCLSCCQQYQTHFPSSALQTSKSRLTSPSSSSSYPSAPPGNCVFSFSFLYSHWSFLVIPVPPSWSRPAQVIRLPPKSQLWLTGGSHLEYRVGKDSKAIFGLIGEDSRDRLLMSAMDTGRGGGSTNSAILSLGFLQLTPETRQLLLAWPPSLQRLPPLTLSRMLFPRPSRDSTCF